MPRRLRSAGVDRTTRTPEGGFAAQEAGDASAVPVAEGGGTWGNHAAFLDRHVATFNRAVETGDFAPLVELFAPDARLAFADVPIGPFDGRAAIGAAYEDQPPSDTMTILDREVAEDGTIVQTFSWAPDAGAPSGEMRLRVVDEQIEQLIISFL